MIKKKKNQQPNILKGEEIYTLQKEDVHIARECKGLSSCLNIKKADKNCNEILRLKNQNGNTKVWRECLATHCLWVCKFVQPLWKILVAIFTRVKCAYTLWPSSFTFEYDTNRRECYNHQNINIRRLFIETLFIVAPTW